MPKTNHPWYPLEKKPKPIQRTDTRINHPTAHTHHKIRTLPPEEKHPQPKRRIRKYRRNNGGKEKETKKETKNTKHSQREYHTRQRDEHIKPRRLDGVN